VIYAGHKGFVRLAIEQGSALVPVLALGEVLQVCICVCVRVCVRAFVCSCACTDVQSCDSKQ